MCKYESPSTHGVPAAVDGRLYMLRVLDKDPPPNVHTASESVARGGGALHARPSDASHDLSHARIVSNLGTDH